MRRRDEHGEVRHCYAGDALLSLGVIIVIIGMHCIRRCGGCGRCVILISSVHSPALNIILSIHGRDGRDQLECGQVCYSHTVGA